MSVNSWKLEKGLCRCCHAEGAFKSLGEPSYNLGQVEVFSDMLRQCLDIEMQPVEGVYSESTYTICDACAHRLRDASNFKQQVLQCEERFRDMYKNVKALGNIQVKQETETCAIEYQMKIEQTDDDDDAGVDFGQDGDGDEDDNKTVLQLLLEGKKEKGKGKAKPKAKPKPKAKKAVPKPAQAPKSKPAKPKKVEKKEDDTPKKGDNLGDYYTVQGDRYLCNQCGKTFSAQPLVSQHYRFVHLKRRPRVRKCPHCDEKIPEYLRAFHLDKAHGIPAPTCGICQKKFRYNCYVIQHQKKEHMGERTAECNICSKSFFTDWSLRLHMATHSEEKKYKCDVCQREFRWENNLKDHVKLHAGDKRHICGVCGKAFAQKSTLKKHSSRIHPGRDS